MENPLTVIPEKVRKIAYAVYVLLSPVVVYLVGKNYIGDLESSLWLAYGALLGAVAYSNVRAEPEEDYSEYE